MIEDYRECNILSHLQKSSDPIITKVKTDEFTDRVSENFDYDFDGTSKFYSFVLPKVFANDEFDFQIMVITGASGTGKSTLLKQFSNKYRKEFRSFDNDKAIVSNFDSPDDAVNRLSAVGLNSMPVWCRPRNVLSIGEGFRADLALNIDNYTIFDEFTSTIDRNVAKSTCNSISKYIRKNNLHNVVFCSCHNDYIPYLKPDIVIDLNEEAVYDCRKSGLGKTSLFTFTNQQTRVCGEYLGDIII